MSIGKLGDKESLAILREGVFGRLGCIAAGWPYVVPVNYFSDGNDIYQNRERMLHPKSKAWMEMTRIVGASHTINN